MAIILPETYLHAPSKKYVLQYLTENNNIQGIIDLPQNTFRPFCGVKTCLVIVQKNILMGVVEQAGQDHKGNLIYRFDKKNATFTKDIWDDTLLIRKRYFICET
nr:hypothetical protein [Caulerpa lentillifera]